jgi:branched-chain amino acid transport system substrate-binding protein
MLSGDGWDDPKIIERSKKQRLGDIYFTSHRFRGVKSSAMKSFVAAYTTMVGEPPRTAFAPLGYDTVHLVAEALRRAGSTDPAAIRENLANPSSFPGIVGPITYAEGTHVPIKSVEVIRLESGVASSVGEVTPDRPEPDAS